MRTKTVVTCSCIVGYGGEVDNILSLYQSSEQGICERMNIQHRYQHHLDVPGTPASPKPIDVLSN